MSEENKKPPLVDQLLWSRDNASGATLTGDEVEELCGIVEALQAERDAAFEALNLIVDTEPDRDNMGRFHSIAEDAIRARSKEPSQ